MLLLMRLPHGMLAPTGLVGLTAGGIGYLVAPLAFSMGVALNALEFLVAGLQAYVFAILTCVYLNDAMHPSH